MKLHLKLSTTIIFFGLLAQTRIHAEETPISNSNETKELQDLSLEELLEVKISSVSRIEESFAKVPMSSYVVTDEDMKRWGVRNLYETLQRVPGYSFYNTDYYGQYGVISRGLQSVWRFGMSIELMPLNDWGHFVMPKRFFKAMEVARGPGGLMWGSAAEAGLINFQVRDDLDKKTEATLEVGNEGRQAMTLAYGSKIGTKSGDYFFVGWHGEKQDFVTKKKAYDDPSLTWRENGILPSYSMLTKTKIDKIKLITWFERDSHVSPDIWYAGDRTTATRIRNDLDRLNGPAHDEMDIEAVRGEYHLLDTDDNKFYIYTDYFKRTWRTEGIYTLTDRTEQVGFASVNNLLDKKLEITFGGNLFKNAQKNAPHGTTALAQSYNVDFVGNSPFHTSENYNDLYFQTRYQLSEKVGLLGGVRGDNQAGEGVIVSGPRLGTFYSPSNKLTFKYLYNSTKRRPQGNELGQGLGPETLTAHEVVAIVNPSDAFNANITLYTQTLTDQMVRANNGTFNSFSNGGGLTSQGVEWAINYKPIVPVLTYWNGSYQTSRVKSHTVMLNNVPTESSPHDGKNRPYFVPTFTSFLGSEVSVNNFLKINGALRSITGIPYIDKKGSDKTTGVHFVDTTIRTRQFSEYNLELAFSVLNLLDNQKRVPAYGEHSNNAPGTLTPEGRRYYLQASTTF